MAQDAGTTARTADEAVQEERLDKLDKIGRATVKVATSAVLATTLASALSEPPHAEMMTLPEPVPIVQMYQATDDDPLVDEDDDQEKQASRWRRLLKALKYLLVALLFVGSLALGILKGCAGVVGTLLLPDDDEHQEQVIDSNGAEDTAPVPA